MLAIMKLLWGGFGNQDSVFLFNWGCLDVAAFGIGFWVLTVWLHFLGEMEGSSLEEPFSGLLGKWVCIKPTDGLG